MGPRSGVGGSKDACSVPPGSSLMVALARAVVTTMQPSEPSFPLGDTLAPLLTWDPSLSRYMMWSQ